METKLIGKWSFLIGLAIAIIAGFITGYAAYVAVALFVLGLIVGLLNISERNSTRFLVAVIALLAGVIASINALSLLGVVIIYVNAILGNFVAFISSAALVVAIKEILTTSQK